VSKNVSPIDRSLGSRLRDKRISSGLTEEQLAARLEIDAKDVILYETGAKRISAERLLGISQALEVRPGYFFDFHEEGEQVFAEDMGRAYQAQSVYLTLPEQGMRLNRAFVNVRSSALREAIVALVVEMAGSASAEAI